MSKSAQKNSCSNKCYTKIPQQSSKNSKIVIHKYFVISLFFVSPKRHMAHICDLSIKYSYMGTFTFAILSMPFLPVTFLPCTIIGNFPLAGCTL